VEGRTRNNSMAGIVLLIGAALIGLGATRSWVTGLVNVPVGRLVGLAPNGALGFDLLFGPDGSQRNVEPLMLGAAAVVALAAVLLLATGRPGPGAVWRGLALVAIAGSAFVCVTAWSVVNDPSSILGAGDIPFDEVLQALGLLEIRPGLGLWLLTGGCAVAAIGVLIPAVRVATSVPASAGPPGPPRQFPRQPLLPQVPPPGYRVSTAPVLMRAPMPPGWFPDQLDRSLVRWFDGVRWTDFTQPHP
jgi:hypothetical protein